MSFTRQIYLCLRGSYTHEMNHFTFTCPARFATFGVGQYVLGGDGGQFRRAALRGGQQPSVQDLLDVWRPRAAVGHGVQHLAPPGRRDARAGGNLHLRRRQRLWHDEYLTLPGCQV